MKIAIGLGCSLGDRRATLEKAVRALHAHPHLRYLRGSRWYCSPPMRGGTAKNAFLNGVALFESELSLIELLEVTQRLEGKAGRRRAKHWGDRPLDLDLLLADQPVSTAPKVPHPAIALRPFVLWPLLEVWPDARHPATGQYYRDFPRPPGPGAWPVGILPQHLT